MNKKTFLKRLIIACILLSISRLIAYFIVETKNKRKEEAWIKSMRSTYCGTTIMLALQDLWMISYT